VVDKASERSGGIVEHVEIEEGGGSGGEVSVVVGDGSETLALWI